MEDTTVKLTSAVVDSCIAEWDTLEQFGHQVT